MVRWDVEKGTQDKFAIKFDFSPYSICLFNANEFLGVGLSSGDFHIFNLSQRKEIKFYKQHQQAIFSMCENAIQSHLYVGDADGNLSVWDTSSLGLIIYLPFNCGKIRKIKASKDGQRIFIAAQDGILRILDATTFNEINAFEAHKDGVTSILELSELEILTGGKDAHLKLWDAAIGLELHSLPAHNFVIYDLLQLNENVFVSASRDKSIKLWELEPMKVLQRIEAKQSGHKHSVNQLVKILETQFASCSDDGTVIVWNKD